MWEVGSHCLERVTGIVGKNLTVSQESSDSPVATVEHHVPVRIVTAGASANRPLSLEYVW